MARLAVGAVRAAARGWPLAVGLSARPSWPLVPSTNTVPANTTSTALLYLICCSFVSLLGRALVISWSYEGVCFCQVCQWTGECFGAIVTVCGGDRLGGWKRPRMDVNGRALVEWMGLSFGGCWFFWGLWG